jgi:hypothetical protein
MKLASCRPRRRPRFAMPLPHFAHLVRPGGSGSLQSGLAQ